jgi:WD40 repeat protein
MACTLVGTATRSARAMFIRLVGARTPHSAFTQSPSLSFAFSNDGALIATISDDAMVRVWTSGPPREEQT